jgi:hypothetical protein
MEELVVYSSDAQAFYTRGTLNIVEESWRHTNPILHIVGVGGDGLWHRLAATTSYKSTPTEKCSM